MSKDIVFIDADALYRRAPSLAVVGGAESGLYELRFTEKVMDEANKALVKEGVMDQNQADNRANAIQRHVPDALSPPGKEPAENLVNDQGDAHVASAAIDAKANKIITFNVKDYKANELKERGIQVMNVDDFLCDVAEKNPEGVKALLQKMYENARAGFEKFVKGFEKSGCPEFAKKVAAILDDLRSDPVEKKFPQPGDAEQSPELPEGKGELKAQVGAAVPTAGGEGTPPKPGGEGPAPKAGGEGTPPKPGGEGTSPKPGAGGPAPKAGGGGTAPKPGAGGPAPKAGGGANPAGPKGGFGGGKP